jgi:hypothetical protein
MKEPYKGFVLVLTLVLIFLITLLVMTGQHHTLAYSTAIKKQEEQQQHFYKLEDSLLKIARAPQFKGCYEHHDAPNEVIIRLARNEGCLLKSEESDYRYMVEDLGVFPCLIVFSKEKKRSTHHLRITLVSIGLNASRAVLQVRYIKPSNDFTCVGVERIALPGINSWRYFVAAN